MRVLFPELLQILHGDIRLIMLRSVFTAIALWYRNLGNVDN